MDLDPSGDIVQWVRTGLTRLSGALKVNIEEVVAKVSAGIPAGRPSVKEIMELTAETAASLTTRHPDYSILAGRVRIQQLRRLVTPKFSSAMSSLAEAGTLALETFAVIEDHATKLDAAINHSRDEEWTYFGIQTLIWSYLLKIDDRIAELPQHLFMRVAVGIHGSDVDRAIETYDMMSQKLFTHATPTLFNSGTVRPQMASCFLVAMMDDSIEGIFDTLKLCAKISKHAGGIGLHVSNIRAAGTPIGGTSGGVASGIVPMLRTFNNAARFVGQGGNRRPGAISITLEPWHADILAFLDLKKNHGKDEYRARDLFYALWVPDLFMKKVQADEEWHLFSPDSAPGLQDTWGVEFECLYQRYVDEERFVARIRAQKLWNAILDTQIETGNPSILYKDACNAKSNEKNLGTIKSSNLCTEIIQFSSPDEVAVCNLASIALPAFACDGKFDYQALHATTKVLTRNLDIIIDRNFYPDDKARISNLKHRPISIGVQGLADVFFRLELPFDSREAALINEKIFATIYHAALEMSCELAEVEGVYSSYAGSPAASGQLQFDLWGQKPVEGLPWDWERLRERIKEHGLRNALLTGCMPTASTSQLFGYTESVEPVTSNLYTRRTICGEFQVVNSYLVKKLEEIGLWTLDIRERIMASNGSIQSIPEIPDSLKCQFKTVWELSQRIVIDHSAGRGPYIDQSQSLNIFLASPSRKQLTSMHFYGWKKGLKTGLYYLRTLAAAAPIPFTLDVNIVRQSQSASPIPRSSNDLSKEDTEGPAAKKLRSDECEVCSA